MAAPTAAGTAPATTKLAHDATFLTTNARHSSPAVHSKAFLGPGGGEEEEEEEGGGRGPAQPHYSRRHHHPTTSRSLPSTATFAPPPNMKHRSTALPEASSTTSNLPPVAEVAANNNKNRNRPPTLTTDTAATIDPNTRSTTATLLSPSAAADWVTTTPTYGGGGIVDSATNPNHPGSNSPMLSTLSPSRTITSSLTTLVSSTAKQLEVIWDKVGYAPEDRALQLRQLLASFQDLCQAKLVEESSVADTFQQTIVESRLEIARLCRALHASPPPSLSPSKDPQLAKLLVGNNETSNRKQNNNESESDNDDVECANTSTTLMDQLATLEAALEGLQSAADTVRNELVACREFIVEAHNALGSELDPTWLDIDSDLSLERRDAFVRHKDELGHEVASRSATVVQLVRDCRQLMNELQLGPDFSDNDKEEAGDKDEDDSAALDQRIYGSIVLGKDGGYVLASKHRSNTCVGISSRAVDELTKRFAVLHAEKRRRRVLLQNMGAEIAPLWDKLKVPEAQQQAFMESVQGLGLDTIRKGQAELDRLRSLKAAQLGTLIDEARDTICALWKEVHHPLEQQQAFRREYMATDKIPTDELLEQHEEYISELQRRLEQMRPIVRQIERREDIVRERQEYEELQKDPDRLKQRGAALTRQLLEEEKMARRIKKDLPRLTELLDVTLRQWKVEHGEDFRYGDDNDVYLDVMERQEDEWQRYRELEQQRKIKKKQEEHTADLRPGKLHLPGKENFAVKVVRQQQQHQPLGVVGVSRPLQDAPSGAGKRVATTAVSARGVGPSLPHLLSHKYK